MVGFQDIEKQWNEDISYILFEPNQMRELEIFLETGEIEPLGEIDELEDWKNWRN